MIDLKRLYNACNAKYFNGELPGVNLEWSSRLFSCAGKCQKKNGKYTIKLSIDYHQRHPNEIVPTLIHEMIHVKISGHGQKFKKELKRINDMGGTVHRYSKESAKEPRWQYICTKCGTLTKRYRRVPKRYVCGKCRSPLIETVI
jgi:predicted SprT family Zn-dependent metalloprotease